MFIEKQKLSGLRKDRGNCPERLEGRPEGAEGRLTRWGRCR